GDAFVLVDASVTTGNLTMGVIGLGLGSSLEAFAPAFTIEGIDLSFSDGPVRIAGGLRGSLYPLSFTGELLIETSELNIAALGAYAKVDDHPSFFSYAVLDDPIGGPAFFYVTGLAAGFGFNRKLVIPNVDGVATFPFVEWAMDTGNPPGMATGSNAGQQVNQVLTRLTQGGVVAPSIGEDWLAVGVRFTSFEMIRSFALLTAEFGNEFEIALLGLSTLQVPNNDPAPVAVAELALDARFIPASGILSVAAVLTPNSYILSRSCRLTGGFAFDAWFGSNPHEGDFVVTFGGYNPHYHLPGWYPPEPRIGFRWLDGPVTISGDCYFALVPHVVMAGGGLNVVYQEGRIRAWLTVYADFLIEWKPFHYEIDAGVSIGASVRVGFPIYSTIKVELSADIEIWGPPMAGKAHISVMVFSVTVHFGADMANSEPAPLSWDEFQSAFLPQHKSEGAELVLEADASPASKTDAVSVRIASGIIKQVRDDKTGEISYTIVNADELALSTASVIPSTSVTVQGSNQSLPSDAATKLYVRPMKQQEVTLNSQHVVVMSGVAHTGADASPVLDTEVHLKNVPTALWGEPGTEGIPALNPEGGSLVKNAVTGTRLTVSPPQQPGGDIGPFPLNRLEFDAPCFHTLFWGVFRSSPAEGYDQSEAISQIEQTIEVNNQRNTILDELKSAGLDIVTAVDPSDIGENAKEIFYQAPILSRLGDLPPTQPGAG
ncbi:MAG: hypothetical protein JJ956_18260, partial [Pseudomonadales bacterium]|nr:hypothetical protein [Pseudomonadales bacterium]